MESYFRLFAGIILMMSVFFVIFIPTSLQNDYVTCKNKTQEKVLSMQMLFNCLYICYVMKEGKLDLSNQKIIMIRPMSFKYSRLIFKLDLSGNKIRCLEKRMFLGLDHLQILLLKKNEISELYEAPFEMLRHTLRILDLSSNQLPYFNSSIIASLNKLKKLDLQSNQLKVIADDLSIVSHLNDFQVLIANNNPTIKYHEISPEKVDNKSSNDENAGKTWLEMKEVILPYSFCIEENSMDFPRLRLNPYFELTGFLHSDSIDISNLTMLVLIGLMLISIGSIIIFQLCMATHKFEEKESRKAREKLIKPQRI